MTGTGFSVPNTSNAPAAVTMTRLLPPAVGGPDEGLYVRYVNHIGQTNG
ncbi:MAG: hypothetical protein IJG25_00835 [Thermoguttaceae bacterium]|nr:hypothetical protein [Thermoguttaceae bacterium]